MTRWWHSFGALAIAACGEFLVADGAPPPVGGAAQEADAAAADSPHGGGSHDDGLGGDGSSQANDGGGPSSSSGGDGPFLSCVALRNQWPASTTRCLDFDTSTQTTKPFGFDTTMGASTHLETSSLLPGSGQAFGVNTSVGAVAYGAFPVDIASAANAGAKVVVLEGDVVVDFLTNEFSLLAVVHALKTGGGSGCNHYFGLGAKRAGTDRVTLFPADVSPGSSGADITTVSYGSPFHFKLSLTTPVNSVPLSSALTVNGVTSAASSPVSLTSDCNRVEINIGNADTKLTAIGNLIARFDNIAFHAE